MECCDCKSKLTAYLAGSLAPDEAASIGKHLHHCLSCRDEVLAYRELDLLIEAADLNIPPVDLTAGIMHRVKGSRRKKTVSLIQDIVAAAAAAIIIFWAAGPVLAGAGGTVPGYTKGVVNVTTSVGGVVQSYMDFSATTVDRVTHSIEQIDAGQMKGAE